MPLIIVDNLRPNERVERLEPTRNVLRNLYAQHYLQDLPGIDGLRRMRSRTVTSAVEDQSLALRFLGQRFGRNVLFLDMGAMRASALLYSDSHYSEAISGRCGTQIGALDILMSIGEGALLRWLPFDLTPEQLENRLLNRRLLSPHAPADLDDLLLDHALLREGLRQVYAALRDERPTAPIDLVIVGGAVARSPRPGLAALTILDALSLEGSTMAMAIDIYLDSFGLLAAGGALARVDADAAACLLEQDALNNGPLATVIVPYGQLQGQVAEVELTPVGGEPLRITVEAGTIARLPLARGRRATLRVQPAPGVAIGQNPRGAEVLSTEAAISGSALGVLIDARPRPLAFPETAIERQLLLVGHLRALDALPSTTAYAEIRPFQPAAPVEVAADPTASPSSAPAAPVPTVVSAPVDMAEPSGDNDMADFRKGLLGEAAPPPPAKTGFFGRKK